MPDSGADRIREVIRDSYRSHRDRLVWQELPEGMTLYSASLYSVLSAWYQAIGRGNISEILLLAELAPFIQMPEIVGVEMLAEYAVFIEMPSKCNLTSLTSHVLAGLEKLVESERQSLLGNAHTNKFTWISLLA